MEYTKKQVMEWYAELKEEEKKTTYEPVYYKYRGEMKRRSYDKTVYTERYEELFSLIGDAPVFKCKECGEMRTLWELEKWICDFEEGDYTCGMCYEDYMGEDL